jgi:hypothetical protein
VTELPGALKWTVGHRYGIFYLRKLTENINIVPLQVEPEHIGAIARLGPWRSRISSRDLEKSTVAAAEYPATDKMGTRCDGFGM